MLRKIELLKKKLQERASATAPPVKWNTLYYVDPFGKFRSHLYRKGIAHECGIAECPSSN